MRPKERREPRTEKVLGIILLCVCVSFVMVTLYLPEGKSVALEATSNSGEPGRIDPGASVRREVAVNKDQLLRLSIDKGDLLLSTTLYGPTGVKLLAHVSQDFEIVELSFPAQVAGTYTIELRSQESDPAPREYELTVQPLTQVTTQNQKDSEARQAMARGEMLRAKSVEASSYDATAQFDRATQMWTSISDFANAAQAALKSGDVYFALGQYEAASKRYQNAEEFARRGKDWLAEARALSQLGRAQSILGNNDLAQKQLAQAVDLFKEHEAGRTAIATNAYGDALTNLAEVSYSVGNFVKSLDQLEIALKVFQDYRKGAARAHLLMGQITGSIGEIGRAVTELTTAHELYQSINDKNNEMLALSTKELAHSGEGNESPRIELRSKAIEFFQSTGDRQSEATALNSLGLSFEEVKKYDTAIYYYRSALQVSQDIQSVDGEATSALQLGIVYNKNEQPDQALESYEHCLKLARSAGNARNEVYALNGIAESYAAKGLHEQAAAQYQKVLKFHRSNRDRRGQAMALNGYGDSLLELGQKQEALNAYNQAFTFGENVRDQEVRITTRYNLARAYLELGSPEEARGFIQDSLKIIEEVRANVDSPDFRVSYFSGVQENYELCIQILMQLEKLKPGQGLAAEALAVSEKGRARLLVDLVTQVRSTPRAVIANKLLDSERRLSGLLRSQAAYRKTLSPDQKEEIAEVEKDLIKLKEDQQRVLADLRRQQPHLFSLKQAQPLDLERIQNELRDDTMLLEYSLGKTSSYLWVVTSDSFKVYELPDRKTIEDAAREYYKLMTARQGTDGQDYQSSIAEAEKLLPEKAKKLGEILLGPIADQLANRRLLVVLDGALQSIPFDALPVPGTNSLLLQTNEVVVEPSMSTLVAIRAKENRSRSTRKLVAVIADPVFSGSDDRVQTKGNSSEKNQFNRLIHASEEADAITAVAPSGTTMVAKGFDASRETAMSSDVAQYQIVHFATHAVSDEEHPELSNVVLTMMDRNGEKTDGLMAMHDIYSMDLAAELTVLSACQTALGKDTKGEGLVGLTHGFISAGSKTVVASLWKVDDRATAVLMADLYKAMLQQGMSPPAALRAAKLKMMQDKDLSAPYYWAGFVAQGEYANHIAVDQHSSLRFGLILLFLLGLVGTGLFIFQKRKRRFAPPQSS